MAEKEQKLDPQDNRELHAWLNNDAQTVADFLDFVWKHKEGKRAESS
jgi:hypothetical protein